MSIVRTTPGVPAGAPDRVTFRVIATGSTDAAYQAKQEAKAAGYVVKTLGAIRPGQDLAGWQWKTEPGQWEVDLVVRTKA